MWISRGTEWIREHRHRFNYFTSALCSDSDGDWNTTLTEAVAKV